MIYPPSPGFFSAAGWGSQGAERPPLCGGLPFDGLLPTVLCPSGPAKPKALWGRGGTKGASEVFAKGGNAAERTLY